METGCIFCKIIAGTAPADMLYRDELVMAFRDIHPVAPTHVLVVPLQHYASLNEVSEGGELVLGRLMTVAKLLAVEEAVDRAGYRLILNTGPHGGQVVDHLHLHLIGGRPMRHGLG